MQDRSLGPILIVLLALTLLEGQGSGAQAQESPLAECQKRFAADPLNQKSARCFYEVAGEGLGEGAAREIRRLRADHPDNPWLPLYLGHVIYRSSSGAEVLYREALDISQRLGYDDAEVEARLALTRLLARLKRPEEIRTWLFVLCGPPAMLEAAEQVAEKNGNPHLRAKVSIRQAFQLRDQGKDLDLAHVLLNRVRPDVLPDGEVDLQRSWLLAMAQVSRDLGRNDEAMDCMKRLLAIALEAGNLNWEADARYPIGILHLTTELPSVRARQEARRLFKETLTAARAAENMRIEGRAHLQLGKLLGGNEGRKHLEACLDIARNLHAAVFNSSYWSYRSHRSYLSYQAGFLR